MSWKNNTQGYIENEKKSSDLWAWDVTTEWYLQSEKQKHEYGSAA